MLTLTCKISAESPLWTDRWADEDSVELPFDIRARTRLRVTLASGREAGIVLARGERLRDGDLLTAEDGTRVRVIAAPEPLLEATATKLLALTAAAYHLGNRHVPVQIIDLMTLRLPVDHVLAELLRGLGLLVREVHLPFDPEGGAYATALHETDHSHLLDREAPVRIRRTDPVPPAGLVDPGHGDHRSPRRIHDFAAAPGVTQ